MELLAVPIQEPVEYLKSGLFTAELGWKHHRMTHSADTELIIGVSGQVHLKVGQDAFTVGQGDILTVFPYETISCARPTTTPSKFIWIHYVQPRPTKVMYPTTWPKTTNDRALLPRFIHLKRFSQTIIASRQLLDLTHDPESFVNTKNYQTSLVILTIANAVNRQMHQQISHQTSINEVCEWIRINVATQPSVAQIAAHFFLNPDYLNRLFKRETGSTITTYIRNLKIEYAKLLLLSTHQSIQDVCEHAFFNDAKYFARVFRASTNLAPSQYRQAYTHTFLNNNQVDPGVDLKNKVSRLEHNI
ncbi:AraC family transcriptional regulator [Lactiplantibacillus fabifermentans T30PCM01]|uniref:AraC family transcriptional regulator n=1 Tax=Lactiplantibacillus fabifermentans T30PCM01 TaxID=1400520 RepID=W6T443_9LACO|nr:AraC family transcriptional regulator [Lactiplantibacillus fabifermentans]ETY72697.1 AraC family transcriptional regulator [Lactiplantibacillus fabifermentans T30PCM01]